VGQMKIVNIPSRLRPETTSGSTEPHVSTRIQRLSQELSGWP
jgi:hypothetical protein